MTEGFMNEYGQIRIAPSVIATIAGVAATESYGLVGMMSRNLHDNVAELLRRENFDKGVDVRVDGENVEVDLYISVRYGTNIRAVARNVMEKVKYTLEHVCGLNVTNVHVTVQEVRVGSEYQPGAKARR